MIMKDRIRESLESFVDKIDEKKDIAKENLKNAPIKTTRQQLCSLVLYGRIRILQKIEIFLLKTRIKI